MDLAPRVWCHACHANSPQQVDRQPGSTGGRHDIRCPRIPTAVSVFPDELDQAPRSWAERAYPKLVHDNRPEKGGHFAAWEQPEAFCEELRAGFRSLRTQ